MVADTRSSAFKNVLLEIRLLFFQPSAKGAKDLVIS